MRRGYQAVNRTHGLKMDGGIPGAYNNVLWRPDGYRGSSGLVGPVYANLAVGWAQLQNRSGSTAVVGIGARLHNDKWRAYTLNAAQELVDDTVDAQDAGAGDFPIEVSGGNNSGFMVASPDKFNVIDMLISQASTAGSPVRQVQYSGPAGWVTYANPLVAPVTAGQWVAEETLVWIGNPVDFTPMTEALHGTGVPVGWYGIRVRATTAPTVLAGLITSMTVAQARQIKALTDGSTFGWLPGSESHELLFDCGADALVGIVSVAHDANEWDVLVGTRG